MNYFTRLALSAIIGVAVGVLGMFASEGIRDTICTTAIIPLYETFYKLIGCAAGPMIFLSVTWGIYGIGDTATLGKIGVRMILRYVGIVFSTTLAGLIWFPLIGPKLTTASSGGGRLSALIELLTEVFPSSIAEPFITGNTLQIIFLASVIGIALLALGKQTRGIAQDIQQINSLAIYIMSMLSRLLPYVIFLIVVNLIWSGTYLVLASVWKLALVMLAAFLLASLFWLLYTSLTCRVSLRKLTRSLSKSFTLALSTASSSACFNLMTGTCENKFGIDESFTSFGLPLSIVLCKPIAALYNLLLIFFLAGRYHVDVSGSWLLITVILCALVAIATPPIPGGNIIAYTLLFTQLGMPNEALNFAIGIDVITDFLVTACDVVMVQLALLQTACSVRKVNERILRSPDGI